MIHFQLLFILSNPLMTLSFKVEYKFHWFFRSSSSVSFGTWHHEQVLIILFLSYWLQLKTSTLDHLLLQVTNISVGFIGSKIDPLSNYISGWFVVYRRIQHSRNDDQYWCSCLCHSQKSARSLQTTTSMLLRLHTTGWSVTAATVSLAGWGYRQVTPWCLLSSCCWDCWEK